MTGPRNLGKPRPARVLLPGETEASGFVALPELFGREAPTELEIGIGRARFLLREAALHPERNYFGIELQDEYARIAESKAEKLHLSNVRIASVDGKAFILSRIAPASLAALHVYFPDPWPKSRHHKRRLVDAEFAAAAARALSPGALFWVASDHAEYFESMRLVLEAEASFRLLPADEILAWTAGTDYELKFEAKKKPIGRGVWRRVPLT
ncbi:MAG: tRNA (guanosine(46)-N7)-methyltransferase TrmB [Thermoanaerobaculia bacterium]